MSDRVMPQPPAGRSTARRVGFWLLTTLFLASLYTPAGLFADDRYWLPLFSRWLALAIFALSVDLVWGYTGLLSLGQGLYFGVGAYLMAYYLAFQKAAAENIDGIPGKSMPDFMYRCGLNQVPGWLSPLAELPVALLMILFLPTALAFFFGLVSFRFRIKGVYFSLITQALVLAVYLLVENQQAYTGGVVGMPGLPWLTILGFKFSYLSMFLLIATTLVVSFLACLWLISSRFGRVLTAIRDNETRVLALGYSTAMYKTFIFAAAGLMAGIAGALYVASERTVGARDSFGIAFSIEIVILVAVGGRGTLFGPVLGTVLVLLGKTYANNEFKQAWPLILAGLFIGVVVFLPEGIVGWLREAPARAGRWARRIKVSNPVPVPVG
jgi:urea transport system permease protein